MSCPHCAASPFEHHKWERAVEKLGAENAAGMVERGELDCPAADGDGLYLVPASAIRPERVEWLEDGLIPLRTATLVVGLDGVGKSTLLYAGAAKLSRGTLAGAFHGEPVGVVVASSEDHPNSVIIPRLIASGADLARVHIVKVRRDGINGDMSLPDHVDELAAAVARVGARLLIIDPLVAHLPLAVDSHKAQHIRSVMAPLAHLAEEARLAVCSVVHFNGSTATDVRTRISGSKAMRDAARSVLVCGPDPSDESRYIVLQDKNSFGPKATTGRAYRIEGVEVEHHGETIPTSHLVWLGSVEIDSQRLLAGPETEMRTERDLAREVITTALEGGEQRWSDIVKTLRAEGITNITGRRARDGLKREGLIGKVRRGSTDCLWHLPANEGSSDQLASAGHDVSSRDTGSAPRVSGIVEGSVAHHPEGEHLTASSTATDLPTCSVCGLRNSSGERTHPTCDPTGDITPEQAEANILNTFPNAEPSTEDEAKVEKWVSRYERKVDAAQSGETEPATDRGFDDWLDEEEVPQ